MSNVILFSLWTFGVLGYSALFVWMIFRGVKSVGSSGRDVRSLRRRVIRSGVVLSLPLMFGIVDVVRGEQPKTLLIVQAIPLVTAFAALRVMKRYDVPAAENQQ